MADPAAPAGGFQNGGWYEGRQYWNGSFGAPGVINNPNQVGAGQPVSSEVNRQSDVAQGLPVGTIDNYLAGETAKYYNTGGQPPTSSDQVTPMLNDFQASQMSGDVMTRMGQLKDALTPGAAPTPINRVNEFNNLRTQYGVANLEQELTNINKQIADVQTLNEQRQYKAETGQVALGVIGGRQTEIQRQTQIQLDSLNRAKSVMVDELNMKYGIIDKMINFMGLDYQDAVAAYDKAFDRNIAFYEMAYQQVADEKTAARANLQILSNAIMSGNMTLAGASPEARMMINKLEVQAGLPIGFTQSLQMSPKDRLLAISDDKTQALVIGANGQFQPIATGLSKSTSSSGGGGTVSERLASTKKEAFSEMEQHLTDLGGDDGIVSPKEWSDSWEDWRQTVPNTTLNEFKDAFQAHTNTQWGTYIGLPAYKAPSGSGY